MLRGQFFIFLVICIYNAGCVIHIAHEAGKELVKLYAMIDNIKLNTTQDHRRIDENYGDGSNEKIKHQMDVIDKQLERMDESIYTKLIHSLIELPPSEILLYKCLDTFELFAADIDRYYSEFREYLREGSYLHKNELQQLLQQITWNIESEIVVIRKLMNNANEFLPHDKNLAFAVTGYASTVHTMICNVPRIISSILVDLFKITIIAEIKASAMLVFANIRRVAVNEEWKVVNSRARDLFVSQFGAYVKTFEINLELTDAMFLRACDPADGIWIRSKSFYEIEGLIQTTIYRYHWYACKHDSCNAVLFRKPDICNPSTYDRRSSCLSTVAECAYLSAVEACVLKRDPYKFQYVKSTELGQLGRDFTCPQNDGYIIKDGTGWNASFATCACNCYGHHNRISLLTMESRLSANMVIIGLRFVRKSKILYIQPKVGKLEANGYIRRNSQTWMSIPLNIEASKIHRINRANRVFFFDDLRLPSGYALTGVKFNKITRGTVTGFAIEIFGSPFNYATGQLYPKKDGLIAIQVSKESSGMELSFERISSVYTTSLHRLSPENMKYVSLQRSSLRDDFGQSTLPLFDALPVEPHFPSVLGGVGIFHKGVNGYSGLISFRVYGLTYAKYFTDFETIHMMDGRKLFNQSQFNGK